MKKMKGLIFIRKILIKVNLINYLVDEIIETMKKFNMMHTSPEFNDELEGQNELYTADSFI